MLDQASWSNITAVISGSLSDLTVPLQRRHGLARIEELNCLVDSLDTFLGPESDLSVSLKQVPIKLVLHLLKIWDIALGVLPQIVVLLKNSSVFNLDICAGFVLHFSISVSYTHLRAHET